MKIGREIMIFSSLIFEAVATHATCNLLKISNKKLEQSVLNMFKVNNKDTKTTPMASLWCVYC